MDKLIKQSELIESLEKTIKLEKDRKVRKEDAPEWNDDMQKGYIAGLISALRSVI